jgi:hypothetical protein
MPVRSVPVISRGKPVAPKNPEGVRRVEAALAAKNKQAGFFKRLAVKIFGSKPKGVFKRTQEKKVGPITKVTMAMRRRG